MQIIDENADIGEIWDKIIGDLTENPRDLQTTPKMKSKTPLYFHASTNGKAIFIDNARDNTPSVNLSSRRRLSKSDMTTLYPIYLKRENGEPVSKIISETKGEAKKNQTYAFGISKYCT